MDTEQHQLLTDQVYGHQTTPITYKGYGHWTLQIKNEPSLWTLIDANYQQSKFTDTEQRQLKTDHVYGHRTTPISYRPRLWTLNDDNSKQTTLMDTEQHQLLIDQVYWFRTTPNTNGPSLWTLNDANY